MGFGGLANIAILSVKNMELSYLIKELRQRIKEIKKFKSYVIRANPEKDDDYLELPIKDVVLDEDRDEINIVLHEVAGDDQNTETLSVGQLLDRLEAFLPIGSDFQISVSHQVIGLGEEYLVRLNVPIVAHGFSERGCSFGLLEKESK